MRMQMRRSILPIFLPILLAVVPLFVLSPRQVYGVVSDELDGKSVAGAAILAGKHSVYADQTGHYSLGWVYSTVTLTVWMDGYLPRAANVPKGKFPVQAVPFHITLIPNTLSGIVRDAETGVLLPSSVITAGELQATTDKLGHYTLRRVKTGTPLSATLPGYEVSTAVFSGQEMQDFVLWPTETSILVLDLYSRQPVPGSVVVCGSIRSTTDANGMVVIKRLIKGSSLSIQAVGYATTEFVYDDGDTVSVALRPNTLRGVIRDSSNAKPVEGATVTVFSAGKAITSSVTGADGSYSFLDLPSPITLVVAAVGYDRPEIEVGPVTEMDVYLKQFQVKGIYIPFGLLANEKRVRELIDLIERTELNAIVVDVKSDRGWLAYPSASVEAQRGAAYHPEVMDINEFLSLCREKGIYTIARLVIFKDSTLTTAYPEWTVRTEDGDLWTDLEGSSWGDPFRQEVQDYNIAIAKEVAMLGFDELQFDYLRFPSDGTIQEARYAQESTLESRCKTMSDFCARLRSELGPYAVLLSADLFGLTVWVPAEADMGIGQRVMDIAPHMDYISPMLYPSTFASGSLGYVEPMLYPYEVVYRSCIELSKRTATRVRPWLQHYSWNNMNYGVKEMRLQKAGAIDAETHGWMFWNAAGRYDEQVFDPAQEP